NGPTLEIRIDRLKRSGSARRHGEGRSQIHVAGVVHRSREWGIGSRWRDHVSYRLIVVDTCAAADHCFAFTFGIVCEADARPEIRELTVVGPLDAARAYLNHAVLFEVEDATPIVFFARHAV